MKTDLQASFEVKALDVKAVSIRSPDKSVLEVRHDLLPGDVGHDDHLPSQSGFRQIGPQTVGLRTGQLAPRQLGPWTQLSGAQFA